MPHDVKGNILAEGDLVTITATVKQVSTGENMCNVLLVPVVEDTERDVNTSLWLNAKQVSKVESEVT